MDDKRYAVLIDSDNISSKYISSILDEMTKYGVITYKRIYGDWTSPQAGKWKKELMENSITPIQQFRNTVGKNATDSTLIIDAMDILYTKNVDGFCIVSSDGDFTRLASRLRESGMEVIGMGENKTPRSFRAACSVFTDLELLQDQEDEEITAVNNKQRPNRSHNIIRISKIENAIIEIIQENDNKGKQTDLGEIGSRLQKKYSDFDVRNYGYSSLSTFINEIEAPARGSSQGKGRNRIRLLCRRSGALRYRRIRRSGQGRFHRGEAGAPEVQLLRDGPVLLRQPRSRVCQELKTVCPRRAGDHGFKPYLPGERRAGRNAPGPGLYLA